jgi:hypothetical protein
MIYIAASWWENQTWTGKWQPLGTACYWQEVLIRNFNAWKQGCWSSRTLFPKCFANFQQIILRGCGNPNLTSLLFFVANSGDRG